MKKIILVGAVALLGLASCKKDYTCECTATVDGYSASASTTLNATKSDATEACEAGTAGNVVCEIK